MKRYSDTLDTSRYAIRSIRDTRSIRRYAIRFDTRYADTRYGYAIRRYAIRASGPLSPWGPRSLGGSPQVPRGASAFSPLCPLGHLRSSAPLPIERADTSVNVEHVAIRLLSTHSAPTWPHGGPWSLRGGPYISAKGGQWISLLCPHGAFPTFCIFAR